MKPATIKSIIVFLIILVLFLAPVSAAQLEVGPSQTYNTIQEAVDASTDSDIINVHQATYAEDVVINKKLTIQSNAGDNVTLMPANTGFKVIKNGTDDASGTTIKGFTIINSPSGTGINVSVNNCIIKNNHITGGTTGIEILGNSTLVENNSISGVLNSSIQVGYNPIINNSSTIISPDNCKIQDNQINGGLNGIAAVSDHIIIKGNNISKAQEHGIFLFGCYPTITENRISDMMGSGPKTGISLASINITGTTGITITGNNISNINSSNDTAQALDTFIMSTNSSLDSILVSKNMISEIYGMGKMTQVSVVALALNGSISTMKLMENTITQVTNTGVNSTSTGLSVVAMGFDKNNNTTTSSNLTISKNNISGINSSGANSTIKGISFVQLCGGDSSIFENNIFNFKSDKIAVGISFAGVDYTNLQSTGRINKNNISNLTSNNISSGIQSVNLGNTYLQNNIISQVNSPRTKYILVQSPLNGTATLNGNNLEGTGIGEGMAVNGNHTIIHYNRIVNFQHYIQNINSSEAGTISQGNALPIDSEIREYLLSHYGTNLTEEDVTAIIDAYHKVIDAQDNIPSNTSAPFNWYGINSDPGTNKFLKGNGSLDYSPWLVLNITAQPSHIQLGQNSSITAQVYQDSEGFDHSSDAIMFFSGAQVTFTTNLGNVGSKSITLPWTNGRASAVLRADEGEGLATLTASDYQTVQTLVRIGDVPLPDEGNSTGKTIANAASTITMQNTGMPINYLLLALVLVIGGCLLPKRK